MNTTENSWRHIILRAFIVSGVGILVGFILYRSAVFIPRMWPFQFTVSSIPAGVAYALNKSSMRRHLLPALLIWYIILTGLIVKLTWRSVILNFAYVVVITLAVFVYNYVVTKPFSSKAILRIVFAGAIISIANGSITILSAIYLFKFILANSVVWLNALEHNAEIGAVIGLAIGAGIEIAEYLNNKLCEHEINLISKDKIVHKDN